MGTRPRLWHRCAALSPYRAWTHMSWFETGGLTRGRQRARVNPRFSLGWRLSYAEATAYGCGVLGGAAQVRLIRVVAEKVRGMVAGASWVSPYAGECDARLTGG